MNNTTGLLALGAVAGLLSGCDQRAVESLAPPPPPPSAESARDAAISAYRAMWADFASAGTTSDWRSSMLSRHATGSALDKLTRSLRADSEKGLVTKGSPALKPAVSTVDPESGPAKITITDCGDSTSWLKYRKDNGLLADDVPGGRRLIKAAVEKQPDGTWKVSDYGVHQVGSC